MKTVKTYSLDASDPGDAQALSSLRRMWSCLRQEKPGLSGMLAKAAIRFDRETAIDSNTLAAIHAHATALSPHSIDARYAIQEAVADLLALESIAETTATTPRWPGWPTGSKAIYLGRVPPQYGSGTEYVDAWMLEEYENLTLVRRYGPGEGEYLLQRMTREDWIQHWRQGGSWTRDYTLHPRRTFDHIRSEWLETLNRAIAGGYLDPDPQVAAAA